MSRSLPVLLCAYSLFAITAYAAPKDDGWASYIDGTVGKANYYLHQRVLHTTAKSGSRVLSLGSGAGNEEIDLIGRGFNVTAVDSSARSGEIISARAQGLKGVLAFIQANMDKMPVDGSYDWVMSYFALPFGNKADMPTLMQSLSDHMQSGATFSANFFGYSHTFVKQGGAFGMSAEEVDALLAQNGFKVTFMLNRNFDQTDFDGNKTHWDVIDVVAVKL